MHAPRLEALVREGDVDAARALMKHAARVGDPDAMGRAIGVLMEREPLSRETLARAWFSVGALNRCAGLLVYDESDILDTTWSRYLDCYMSWVGVPIHWAYVIDGRSLLIGSATNHGSRVLEPDVRLVYENIFTEHSPFESRILIQKPGEAPELFYQEDLSTMGIPCDGAALAMADDDMERFVERVNTALEAL